MMGHTKRLERGDTIIEVLLAMAVLGLVLGASFGIANRSLQIGQSAKERTAALKIAESQIELMKQMKDTNAFKNRTESFCISTIDFADIKPANEVRTCSETNGSGGEGFYNIQITPPSSPPASPGIGTYAIEVRWDRLGANSATGDDNIDKLTLYYRPGVL